MLRSLSRRLDQRVQALTIVNKDDITDCKKKGKLSQSLQFMHFKLDCKAYITT
jgi:hypothetical protein